MQHTVGNTTIVSIELPRSQVQFDHIVSEREVWDVAHVAIHVDGLRL